MPRRRISRDSVHPFHITARVHNRDSFPIPLNDAWDIFQRRLFSLHWHFGIRIHSFVMMPNHYHAILSDPQRTLSVAMSEFQRETAKEINWRGNCMNQLWGRPYFSSVLESPRYFLNCYKYNYQNPLRAGLCRAVESYRFSTLHGHLGLSHLLIPVQEDVTLFDNIESSLQWLNELPTDENLFAMRKALRRRRFFLPKDPMTKRPHPLETDLL